MSVVVLVSLPIVVMAECSGGAVVCLLSIIEE